MVDGWAARSLAVVKNRAQARKAGVASYAPAINLFVINGVGGNMSRARVVRPGWGPLDSWWCSGRNLMVAALLFRFDGFF